MSESKVDRVIWWLMITFMSVIIVGGGAWAASVNTKVDKIAGLEANMQYIQQDVQDIKAIMMKFIANKGNLGGN